MTAERERILFTRRHLADPEEARQRFHLVGQGDRKAHRRRGERVARVARLIVFADRERNVGGFAVVLRVVLAHDALKFGEFAHHQGAQVGLREHRGAFGVGAVGADQVGEETGHLAHAPHAFGLGAELIVVDDVAEAFDAALQRLLAVLVVEELRVGQTRAHDAGVAGADRFAAVLGFELRDEEEAVHQTARGVAHREVLLVELHREDEALFGNREELLFEAAFVDDRPFRERGDFSEKVLGEDHFGAGFAGAVREKLADQFAAFVEGRDHVRGAHRFGVGVGVRDRDFALREEAVAHRDAAGVEPEELDGDDVGAEERREVLHRAHERNGRHAVGQLIGHHLRNRERAHGVVERGLKTGRQRDARTDAFEDELNVLAVVDALQVGDVAGDAERGHLLRQGRRGAAFGVDADALGHELLREGFFGAFRQNVRHVDGEAARGAEGGHAALGRREVLRGEALRHAVGEGLGELLQSLRREFFGLKFNEQIRHFVFVLLDLIRPAS